MRLTTRGVAQGPLAPWRADDARRRAQAPGRGVRGHRARACRRARDLSDRGSEPGGTDEVVGLGRPGRSETSWADGAQSDAPRRAGRGRAGRVPSDRERAACPPRASFPRRCESAVGADAVLDGRRGSPACAQAARAIRTSCAPARARSRPLPTRSSSPPSAGRGRPASSRRARPTASPSCRSAAAPASSAASTPYAGSHRAVIALDLSRMRDCEVDPVVADRAPRARPARARRPRPRSRRRG